MNSSKNNQIEKSKLKEDSKTTKYFIETNNKIMNEIQELLTEQEIIKKKLIKENNEYYVLELIFPEEITQKKLEIKFLLLITKDYPNKEPELYCLTVFSHPHLCDGRNLINDIIGGEWSKKKLPLENIINKIPKFIIKYNEYKNILNIVGKYTLNQYYKINFLNKLPIYFHLITYDNRILTISDISLCLYDIDKKIGYCKLYFYIDLKDILETKSKPNKKIITIKYKNILNNNKTKNLDINTPNCNAIKAILTEKMKIYKKSGKLPDIDIIKIEKEIDEKEKEVKEDPSNLDKKLDLMSLYQKSVEFYSAINNPKFIEITHKIHKLFENAQSNNNSSEIKEEINNNPSTEEKENKNQINKNKDNESNNNIPNNITNPETKKENEDNIKNKELNDISNNIIDSEKNKDNKYNKIEENKDLKESKKESINKNDLENNIKKEIENDKNIELNEKINSEEKKEDNGKEKKITEKNQNNENKNKIIDKNEKVDIEINEENKNNNNKDKNESVKVEKKEEKKEEKKDINSNLRLKINEGDLGTLDVEEEEEEEEEDEK